MLKSKHAVLLIGSLKVHVWSEVSLLLKPSRLLSCGPGGAHNLWLPWRVEGGNGAWGGGMGDVAGRARSRRRSRLVRARPQMEVSPFVAFRLCHLPSF